MAKIDESFLKRIEDTKLERIRLGVDKKITKENQSVRRYTKAIARYDPLWDILKKAEFKEEIE